MRLEDLVLRSGLLAASRRMDATHGLAAILRDAAQRARFFRMRPSTRGQEAASQASVDDRFE
jgi:hypothetical protein